MNVNKVTAFGRRVLRRRITNAVRKLTVWASSVDQGFKSSLVPTPASSEVCDLVAGVRNMVLFSPHTTCVCLHSFMDLAEDSCQWHSFRLAGDKEKEGGVAMVGCGQGHTHILTHCGRVFAMGSNSLGQCGCGVMCDDVSEWREVPLEGPVTQISSGLDHTLFLTTDGSVWGCGWAADGQIGGGSYESVAAVRKVAGVKAEHVFAGADTSFAITGGGSVLSWGNNEYRQLGIDSTEPQLPSPCLVGVASMDGRVIEIAAGTAFTGFLTEEGSVYVCGYQIEGDSGDEGPALWHQFRCLHDGKLSGRMKRVRAGLHYLIAAHGDDDRKRTVWGKCVLPGHQNLYHSPTKFSLGPAVTALACGPLGLATLSRSDSIHELVSLD